MSDNYESWFFVRHGTTRGQGDYLRTNVWLTDADHSGAFTSNKFFARRFSILYQAQRYAEAFGGRVVRIKPAPVVCPVEEPTR
jgi:hypothetical protein